MRGRSWQRGLTEVNVGTIDPEGGLPEYSAAPSFELPRRWFQTTAAGTEQLIQGGVEVSVAGLVIRYPALRPKEVCHAQFIVAWKERRDEADDDTDFAVDQHPLRLTGAADRRVMN